MWIIAKSKLYYYWKQKPYKGAEQSFRAWYHEVQKATWNSFNDLKNEFPKASIIGNGRVVFKLNGGAFRLIVKIEFKMNAVFIRGTHKEYEIINADEV